MDNSYSLLVASVVLILARHTHGESSCKENVHLTNDLRLTFSTKQDVCLEGKLGLSPNSTERVMKRCEKVASTDEGLFCMDKGGNLALSITRTNPKCYTVAWSENYDSRDCYLLGDRYWYGGGEVSVQRWPLANEDRMKAPYITGDFFHYQYGSVIESLWLSSDGFLVAADSTLDLEVSLNESNDQLLCLNALRLPQLKKRPLLYTICSGRDVRDAAQLLYLDMWRRPEKIPDKLMMTEPVWSTWAYYKANINQSLVLDYAKQIANSKIGASHIEIDDKWEDCYGNLQFDPKKFPEPSVMIEELKKYGFRSTFWVHPFVNEDCEAFGEGSYKGYFVRRGSSEGPPQPVQWWNGVGAYIDTTNPSARDWYVGRLTNLMSKYGFHGYKFDAGEVFWMPSDSVLYDISDGLNSFTTFYVQAASKLGDMVEVRSSHSNQDRGLYVRMLDKNSLWGYYDGLQTLIPTALLFSLFGYPFILPDMIGGNNVEGDGLPEKEMYIRWLLANALLPVMQFSIPPWAYDDEVVEIARDMVKLHRENANLFISLAENATLFGDPIIRPLWWIAPDDPTTFTIGSQFLVGNGLLVAPILEQGATSRDIYLPRGKWRDELRGNEVNGPVWLRGYQATLKELPRFRAF